MHAIHTTSRITAKKITGTFAAQRALSASPAPR
jgi:hypothetical protein